MKLYVAVLLMTIGLAYAAIIHTNGQPGCQTPTEMSVRFYRNIWDPTAYWSCEQQGQNAVGLKCDDGLAWLDSVKGCVSWEQWNWEEPVAPPSKAA